MEVETINALQMAIGLLISLITGGVGYLVGTMQQLRRQSDDLWHWHKPDANGIQSWKLTDALIASLVNKVLDERERRSA